MDIGEAIAGLNIGLEQIADPAAKAIIKQLLNIIEAQSGIIKKLTIENQNLKDENNRLKGEQGKPNIRKQTQAKRDISSEGERKNTKASKKKKGKKKGVIKATRVKHCVLDKADIVAAGLASSHHQQMDDTGGRVKGQNHYTHILCNDLYAAYFTRRHKDRLTILEILSQGEMAHHFNEASYALMEQMGLPEKRLNALRASASQKVMNRMEVDALLAVLFPQAEGKKIRHPTSQRIIVEASAITAYQELPHAIQVLLTDDAPQFKQITNLLALCWVHDGRHYKKLEPVIPYHREQLNAFLDRYWDYYRKLLAFKAAPNETLATSLSSEFEALFTTKTGYEQLDDRIEKTRLKQPSLLLVLRYPELPLHNNTSELAARRQACYRDSSQHTMNKAGTEAKDTFMTLVATAKKLAVNSYHYFYDRLTQKYEMPSLADLIKMNSQGFVFSSA